MTTMLERVAAAQYAVLQKQADGRLPAWDKLDLEARVLMLRQVRAGIETIRDASVPMVEAAVAHSFACGFDRPVWTPTAHWSIQYRRAIDAILAEVPK